MAPQPNMSNPGVSCSTSSLGQEFKSILDSGDNGIHMSFMERHGFHVGDPNRTGSKVVFSGEHPMASEVKRELESYSDPAGGIPGLYPFQIDAITNMVYRPPRIEATKVVRKASLDREGNYTHTTYKDSGVVDLRSRDEDIGLTVVNDLFTGSGKTLTSVLSALIFARNRREGVKSRYSLLIREQAQHTWNTKMIRARASRKPMGADHEYTDTVLILCSKHLLRQWINACKQAMAMMGVEIEIMINPRMNSGTGELSSTRGFKVTGKKKSPADTTRIAIYDSSLSLKKSCVEFVPCIIVDEFVSKHPSNILMRPMEDMPVHGRLLLVSADAGSVKNIVFGANRKSFLRKMIGYDNLDLGFDIEDTMRYGIPMMSTCVLPTEERSRVKDFMVSRMSRTPYEEYVVRYTPSLSSRLFGLNSEMSAVSGKQIFLDRFGIDMDGVKSIGDIARVVGNTVEKMGPSDHRLKNLENLQNTIESFVKDEGSCPVCLESYNTVSNASVLNPCWHIFCDKCVTTILKSSVTKCPMCRAGIEGHVVALNTQEESEVETDRPKVFKLGDGRSFLEKLEKTVNPDTGLHEACIDVLMCLESDVRNRGAPGCYRIIMVVPDDHFFPRLSDRVQSTLEKNTVQIIRFQTVGDKRKRVTSGTLGRSIAEFGSSEGPRVKILFTTEGRADSLTGLDFPNVDCMFSVGFGNNMQRLGRLTRISRFLDETGRTRVVRSIYMIPKSMDLQ